MRISDWSSDVCSSDLRVHRDHLLRRLDRTLALLDRSLDLGRDGVGELGAVTQDDQRGDGLPELVVRSAEERQSVVQGKSVSVRVDPGGRRLIKQKTKTKIHSLVIISKKIIHTQ